MFNINNTKKIILIGSLCAGIVGFAMSVNKANADNLIAGPLEISYLGSGPLFSEIKIAPGDNFEKEVTVTNKGTVNHSLIVTTNNISGDLGDSIKITPIVDGNQVWSETIKGLSVDYSQGKEIISSIPAGNAVALRIRAEFDLAADNNLQDKMVKFNIVLGTQEPEPLPISSPDSDDTDSTIDDSTSVTVLRTVRTLARVSTSAVVSALETQTPVAEVKGVATTAGDVMGDKDEGEPQMNKYLLLIIPAAVILAILVPIWSMSWGLGLPIFGGVVTAVLASLITGDISRFWFWIIFAIEAVLAIVINYFVFSKLNQKKTDKEG